MKPEELEQDSGSAGIPEGHFQHVDEPDDGQGAWDQWAEQNGAGEDGPGVSDHELVEALRAARPVVVKTLGGSMGSSEDVEDVLQQAWIDASAALHRFDPMQGSLKTWVNTIAKRRAVDHIREQKRQVDGQHALETGAKAREQSAVAIWAEDDGYEAVLAAQEAIEQAGPLFRAAQKVMPNRGTFQRAVETIIGCENDIAVATQRLGVSEDALRAARREFVTTCQVIAAAQAARREGQQATVGVLLDCVADSDPSEAGSWRREVADAVAASGRPVSKITGDHVAELTGFSKHTARQYWARMKLWLSVAATVMTTETGLTGDEGDRR